MRFILAMLTLLFSFLLRMIGVAQVCQDSVGYNSYHIEVTFNKTTSLVFGSAILTVDRGSRDILVQKVKEAGNVLQIKAARKDFPETNVTVITASGQLHNINVEYTDSPMFLSWVMNREASITPMIKNAAHDYSWPDMLKKLQNINPIRYGRALTNMKMKIAAGDVYSAGEVMLLPITISNFSAIDFDIESLKFSIQDRKAIARTASQQAELVVLKFLPSLPNRIAGDAQVDFVVALPRFTITPGKNLLLSLTEHNGSRNLRLFLSSRKVLRAVPLR